MSRKHKLARQIRKEVRYQMRREAARLKREMLSAVIHTPHLADVEAAEP